MIPKIIHYCWFGGNPLPESVEQCIESWHKYCPEYKIIQWNESNYNVKTIPYIEQAYEHKKYAFVSDYARLEVIYNYGGIYLDTDVELIKPLDSLLAETCFMGLEKAGSVNTGIGFGSVANHPVLKENMHAYEGKQFAQGNKINPIICVEITSELLRTHGLTNENKIHHLKNLTIYPTEFFCPLDMETNQLSVTNNTYSIHHYDSSWYSENKFLRLVNKKLLPIKIKLKRNINKIFGEGTYQKLKRNVKKEKRN